MLKAHPIIPVGGGSVTIKNGNFVFSDGSTLPASDKALKLRQEWEEELRRIEFEMASRQNRKLVSKFMGWNEKMQKEPEKYRPPELPTDADALFEMGHPNDVGPFVDDFMEQNVQVDYLDGGIDSHSLVPVSSLMDANLPKQIRENLLRMKIEEFLPIQRYLISGIREKFDVIACAPTGTGKSAAFLIPIIERLMKEREKIGIAETRAVGVGLSQASASIKTRKSFSKHERRPSALILVPSRELAMQVHLSAAQISMGTGIRNSAIFGAIDSDLNEGSVDCDILVATPGRAWELINKNILSLSSLLFLVVDEADRLFEKSYPEISKILEDPALPRKDRRTTIFCSATLPVHRLPIFTKHQYRPLSLRVGACGTLPTINQEFERIIGRGEKMVKLRQILQEAASDHKDVLVYSGSVQSVEKLHQELRLYNAVMIHGKMKQEERKANLDKFMSKERSVLLTTDVTSRGLDFPEVGIVVNFNMPRNVEEYIHRIGRTGRKGHSGRAISLIDPLHGADGRCLPSLVKILRESGVSVPAWLKEDADRRMEAAGGKPEEEVEDEPPSDAEDLADLGIFVLAKRDENPFLEWPI